MAVPFRGLPRLALAASGWLLASAMLPAAVAAAAHRTSAVQGTVAGVVADTHGHPLKGICVHGLTRHLPFPATDSSGAYSVKVRPGTYHFVWFSTGCGNSGNWLGQWHTNGMFPFKPAPVVVTAGHTTRVGARLLLGGEIAGRTTSSSGRLLRGICVQLYHHVAYRPSPNFGNTSLITARSPFKLTSVPAGRWRILFFTNTCGTTGNYAQRWWRNARGIAGAKVVTVRPGRVISGIDQRLPAGGIITGRVTGQGGVPLAGVCVEFEGPKYPGFLDQVSTNSHGFYRGQALVTHSYMVFFDPSCGGPPGQYQSQQYPTPVQVTEGKITSGINAQLTLST